MKVQIDSIAAGGAGVARHNGKVCFIPFTAPGDEAEVSITESHASYNICKLEKILIPSPQRIEHKCPHFGTCGGCQFQHLTYEAQLTAKQAIIENEISRMGNDIELRTIIPSPVEYGYRGRARFKFDGRNMGFYAPDSHDIVPITLCPVLSDALNNAISDFHPDKPGEYMIQSDMHGTAAADKSDRTLTCTVTEPYAMTVNYNVNCFFQANPLLINSWLSCIHDFASPKETDSTADLYCGIGIIGLSLAPYIHSLTGIDSNARAIEFAIHNTKQLNYNHCIWNSGTIESVLQSAKAFDLVILDPPREGTTKTIIQAVCNKKPKRIVYVSCNPATWQRDIKRFSAKGYHLTKVQPFDFMPQTAQIELVSLMEFSS